MKTLTIDHINLETREPSVTLQCDFCGEYNKWLIIGRADFIQTRVSGNQVVEKEVKPTICGDCVKQLAKLV